MEALERKTARDKDRTQKKQKTRDRKSAWPRKLNSGTVVVLLQM